MRKRKKELYPAWENLPTLAEEMAKAFIWVGVIVGILISLLVAALIWYKMR